MAVNTYNMGEIIMNNILVSNRRLNFDALKSLQFDNQYILFNTSYGLVVGHPSEIDDVVRSEILNGKSFDSITSSLPKIDLSVLRAIQSDIIRDFDDDDLQSIPNEDIIFLQNVHIFKDNLNEPILSINSFALYPDSILGFCLVPKNALNLG